MRSYVANRREPFYRWLYGDNVTSGDVGHVTVKQVPVCRFVGKKAEETATLGPLPLHEATFTPESIQFYVTKPVAFDSDAGFELNRELGKLGVGHTTDRGSYCSSELRGLAHLLELVDHVRGCAARASDRSQSRCQDGRRSPGKVPAAPAAAAAPG